MRIFSRLFVASSRSERGTRRGGIPSHSVHGEAATIRELRKRERERARRREPREERRKPFFSRASSLPSRIMDSSINMNFRGRTHLIILRERAPPRVSSLFFFRSLFPPFISRLPLPRARARAQVNENVTKICIDSAGEGTHRAIINSARFVCDSITHSITYSPIIQRRQSFSQEIAMASARQSFPGNLFKPDPSPKLLDDISLITRLDLHCASTFIAVDSHRTFPFVQFLSRRSH